MEVILGAGAGPSEGPRVVDEPAGALPAATRRVAGVGEDRIPDALVDELTRRVLQRLAGEVLRDLVAQVVTEVTARIAREEIERARDG